MLTPVESRVLGCLMEKQRTTPQQYPLSESALLGACNQTTNRDPVVSFDVSTVRPALIALREQGFVRMVHRPGERTPKHASLAEDALGLDGAEAAVLCVLLLRGPQTPGELRARTERLHPFADVEAVEAVLTRLSERTVPLVRRLEREPGRKEARYAELVTDPNLAGATADTAGGDPDAAAPVRRPLDELRAEVASLRGEVADLRRMLDELTGG